MNNIIPHSKPPRRNITWHAPRQLIHGERRDEAIVHLAGAALKRCFEYGCREAA